MPNFIYRRWHGYYFLSIFFFMAVLTITLMFFNLWIGGAAFIISGGLLYFAMVAEQAFRKDFNEYIMTLQHRIKKMGNEVVQELPIGVLLYNDEKMIEWHNPFIARISGKESVIGMSMYEVFPGLQTRKDKEDTLVMQIENQYYRVLVRSEERLLYFFNQTPLTQLAQKYEDEKIVMGLLMLDNLDEVTQGMDDQARSLMLAKVVSIITEWSNARQIYLRRTASDRFIMILNQKTLKQVEQERFDILDDVRDVTNEQKLSLTLSIGVAMGSDHLIELGRLAQSSLDVALGRGGDQAAVKAGQRLSFYGGRSNAMEKRTRVRARVISHALRDLMKESDKVVIMGHRLPDMDSIGSAIGVLKAAQLCQKEGYIVLEGVNASIERLMKDIRLHEHINKWMITPEQALQITNKRTLAVVVDTHKASMVAEPKIIAQSGRAVVIDHHRRGEEFINEAVLIYMEPYASSTSELVTELLQYAQERITLEQIEATALMAGIIVDTKSFTMRTGARTFEAASFLRRHGADSGWVQRWLKEDLEEYMAKAEIIRHTEVWEHHVAIAVASPDQSYTQLLIAKVADALLNMTGMIASFAIAERKDGKIVISARSLGQINVQLIMERLGGGGHLTNAAAQMEGTVAEAKEALLNVLQEMNVKGELSE